jgi:hypothetical protein
MVSQPDFSAKLSSVKVVVRDVAAKNQAGATATHLAMP